MHRASLVAQTVQDLPAMQGSIPGSGDPLLYQLSGLIYPLVASLYLKQHLLFPHLQPLVTTPLLCFYALGFFRFHIEMTSQCLFFSGWLVSLSIKSSRAIHAVTIARFPCFSWLESISLDIHCLKLQLVPPTLSPSPYFISNCCYQGDQIGPS